MAYIGKKVEETELDNRTVDTMTGDGSDTTMSLSATPISVNNVLVFLNGVMQRPTTDFTLSGSTITFGAAPFTGAVVVAITGEGGHIGRPSSPLPTEKFMNSAVTSAKISGVAASKLTGSLPALDGAALTGGPDGYTESTSDPAINTNPSTGVGTFWVNKSSGEAFCLTDATAGANVWYNVGGGSGDVEPDPYYMGTTHGYTAGGDRNAIDRFSYSSNGNATDWADLVGSYTHMTGCSSATHGFAIGDTAADIINKFPFASQTNATDTGNLVSGSNTYGHASSDSETHGYLSGHRDGTLTNVIQKLSLSTDGNTTDVANLITTVAMAAGTESTTYGYVAGGLPSGSVNTIQKFQFATDGNATDVANLTVSLGQMQGCSGKNFGYTAGGNTGSVSNIINKYSYTSDSNATDIGNLTVARKKTGGTQSTTSGYAAGGYLASSKSNVIDKFSFTSDGDATDVGDVSTTCYGAAGCQT